MISSSRLGASTRRVPGTPTGLGVVRPRPWRACKTLVRPRQSLAAMSLDVRSLSSSRTVRIAPWADASAQPAPSTVLLHLETRAGCSVRSISRTRRRSSSGRASEDGLSIAIRSVSPRARSRSPATTCRSARGTQVGQLRSQLGVAPARPVTLRLTSSGHRRPVARSRGQRTADWPGSSA